MIHLYYGEGKGKTSAALGLILRALGRGSLECPKDTGSSATVIYPLVARDIYVIGFLKSGNSGECTLLRKLGLTMYYTKDKECCAFYQKLSYTQRQRVSALSTKALIETASALSANACRIVLLDEVGAAIEHSLVDTKLLEGFITNFPKDKELILTARVAAPFMLDIADYITNMRLIRHPYSSGAKARSGIEY